MSCTTSSNEESTSQEENTEITTDENPFGNKVEWDYQPLYGRYQHESTTQGFTAELEIEPEGNDLAFALSVRQTNCNGTADGLIGIAIFHEQEYAGFYDNANCRMEFIFNLVNQTIRIQEIGLCTLHESGCSFNGTYTKVK